MKTKNKKQKQKQKQKQNRSPNSSEHNLRIDLHQRLKEFDSVKREGRILVSKTLRPTA